MILDRVGDLIRQREGKLTRQLLLEPGGFGLGQVPHDRTPDATTTMTCGFCSTGCGLKVHLREGESVGLTPDTRYPVNLGMACPKGWEALAVLDAPDRATTPLVRSSGGTLEPVDWNTALGTFVDRFKSIQAEHGNESVAFLSTGQIPTEEMAALGVLTKFGMGVLHGDGNTRQCMATAVAAYKQSFGFDAPPYTYADFEQSDTIFFIGANPCVAHPIMWERVLRNPHDPAIVVIDPRRTETAACATHHAAIAPKSDLVFFYGLAHILIRNGWIDRAFIDSRTSDFDAFSDHVKPFDPERVEATTGIEAPRLHELAELIHRGQRVSFWWTMGVNQSHEGTRVAQAIINLALMTGNIGRPGTGANSITGQCNAMGSRLFSNTTNLLGGHDFADPAHRRKVAEALGVNASRIPDRNGWAYDQIVEGIVQDKIKGLWVIATNPAHSWINRGHLDDVLDRLDFLVVQDMYHSTETARRADLVLPAAAWGEKDGTFINSERRIGLIKKVARAPGEALADFHIFKLIASYWGCGELFDQWNTPEDVFATLQALSSGQPCDFSGIRGYREIDESGGVQWPRPPAAEEPEQERRLFEDGRFFHADGRARFIYDDPRRMPESTDKRFPLLLLTGRGSASQWHTQTRTGKSAVLDKLHPRGIYIEISAVDADALGVRNGHECEIESRRGRITARAFVTNTVRPGQVFIPMHYDTTNLLTMDAFDPYSRQPSYKACAVRLRPSQPTPPGAPAHDRPRDPRHRRPSRDRGGHRPRHGRAPIL